jgi:hypothetical protein
MGLVYKHPACKHRQSKISQQGTNGKKLRQKKKLLMRVNYS